MTSKPILLLTGTVALLAGCQSPSGTPAPEPRFWLSWSGVVLEPSYQAAADEAVSEWNAALGTTVFAFGWRPFVGVTMSQVPSILEGPGGIAAYGLTYNPVDRPPYVVISTVAAKTQYRVIVAHELGHVLGLTHTTDPKDLMFTSPPVDAVISPDDRIRALEILNSQKVNGRH